MKKPLSKSSAKASSKHPVGSPRRRTKSQYPCRCYALIDGGYDKYILNTATGVYEGPTPCTKEECIQCNTSKAALITS
jgi:hypothetical protein